MKIILVEVGFSDEKKIYLLCYDEKWKLFFWLIEDICNEKANIIKQRCKFIFLIEKISSNFNKKDEKATTKICCCIIKRGEKERKHDKCTQIYRIHEQIYPFKHFLGKFAWNFEKFILLLKTINFLLYKIKYYYFSIKIIPKIY
jgi:hypothetical protein